MPLQLYGAELFARHSVPGILRVDVVELHWRRGDKDKLWVSGHDCFRILHDLQAKLHEGEVIEAKLSICFAGGGRAGQVTLKVPSRIVIKAGPHQALVERLLDTAGIRGSFNDDGTQKNFWSLFPWRLRETDWRRRLGPDFDRLLHNQILRPVSLVAVAHPDHPKVSNALEVVPIDATTMLGVSSDPAIGVRTLTASDIEAYEFQADAWIAMTHKEFQLQGAPRELVQGLWFIGQRTFASSSITISLYVALREQPDIAETLVSADSRGSIPVLLIPECCPSTTRGIVATGCRLPQGPYDGLLESIINKLDLRDSIPAYEWILADLIIDETHGKAWFRRVELTELQPGTHAYKFVVAVTMARGRLVSKEALRKILSGSRSDDEVAKKAKLHFIKAVESSFELQGQVCPSADVRAMFPARAGGYVLEGRARVLSDTGDAAVTWTGAFGR